MSHRCHLVGAAMPFVAMLQGEHVKKEKVTDDSITGHQEEQNGDTRKAILDRSLEIRKNSVYIDILDLFMFADAKKKEWQCVLMKRDKHNLDSRRYFLNVTQCI